MATAVLTVHLDRAPGSDRRRGGGEEVPLGGGGGNPHRLRVAGALAAAGPAPGRGGLPGGGHQPGGRADGAADHRRRCWRPRGSGSPARISARCSPTWRCRCTAGGRCGTRLGVRHHRQHPLAVAGPAVVAGEGGLGADRRAERDRGAAEHRPDRRQAPVRQGHRQLLRGDRGSRQGADLGGDRSRLLPRPRGLAPPRGRRGHPSGAPPRACDHRRLRGALPAHLRRCPPSPALRRLRQQARHHLGLPARARRRLHRAGGDLPGDPVHAGARTNLVSGAAGRRRRGRAVRARAGDRTIPPASPRWCWGSRRSARCWPSRWRCGPGGQQAPPRAAVSPEAELV